MGLRFVHLVVVLSLAGLLALTGCQQAPHPRAVDLGPQHDVEGYPRSVALDSPLLNHLTTRQRADTDLPWYADRNDRTPAAAAGYRLPTIQSSVTLTRDRQYQSGGRIRDQFDRTTYRIEQRQIIR